MVGRAAPVLSVVQCVRRLGDLPRFSEQLLPRRPVFVPVLLAYHRSENAVRPDAAQRMGDLSRADHPAVPAEFSPELLLLSPLALPLLPGGSAGLRGLRT